MIKESISKRSTSNIRFKTCLITGISSYEFLKPKKFKKYFSKFKNIN